MADNSSWRCRAARELYHRLPSRDDERSFSHGPCRHPHDPWAHLLRIANSAVLLVAGFKCEPRSPWRRVLWIQAALGLGIGLLMLTLALEKVDLHWFIALAAVQAFTADFGELALARKACEYRTDRWSCYAGFVTAIAAGAMLLFLRNADLRTLMFWLVCYVLFFGHSQMALSIRLWLTRHQHLREACS